MRKLRRIRAEKGLSMDVLEERSGVSKRTISEIERGMRNPQTLTLARLANGLGISLFDLTEEESPKALSSSTKLPEDQAGEGRLLVNMLAPAVAAAADGWEAYLETLPEQPTSEVWAEENERIAKLLSRANTMVDELEDAGVFGVVGPYADAIIDGATIPQPLHRNVIELHNAIFAISLYIVPKALEWASRSSESRQSENVDKVALEWAARGRIPEPDTAQNE